LERSGLTSGGLVIDVALDPDEFDGELKRLPLAVALVQVTDLAQLKTGANVIMVTVLVDFDTTFGAIHGGLKKAMFIYTCINCFVSSQNRQYVFPFSAKIITKSLQ
jgi:hypothetical protein